MKTVAVGTVGFMAGAAVCAAAVVIVMPGMMIVTAPSRLGFEETVEAVEAGIADRGWASPGTIDMNRSMAKHGVALEPRVAVVQLCKAEYAKSVLTTDRYVASLMPCAIAVYEGEDGKVYVSKMNTGLMGKLFGGNIARVMGGEVAADERAILAGVVGD